MFNVIKNLEQKEVIKGLKGRFVHLKGLTVAFWEIEKGAELPEHAHIHEQTTQVTKGNLEFTVDGKTQVLEPGTMAVIPPNVKHSGKALTYCELTDVFCPVREDYK